jgi:50S ribosomal protein L16 3-hydroxylase
MGHFMQSALEILIHPKSVDEFLSSYSQNKPFISHHSSDHLLVLKSLPFLHSLEALINSWPMAIQAHLPDVRDEISSIDTSAKDAQKLFDNGIGLLFNDVQNISPLLQEWISHLRSDLGLSSLTYGRSLIYATPSGKGTAWHFDQNINFVLQIHGKKKWKVAANKHVANPMSRHTIGTPTDPELMSYLNAPMLETEPENAESFDLVPGSLLFVPRGSWHSTEAEGDALALNFTFSAPTWIDLFSAALRSRLSMSPEWRETADGVSDSNRRADAEDKFNSLLAQLVQDIPNWEACDILNATEAH